MAGVAARGGRAAIAAALGVAGALALAACPAGDKAGPGFEATAPAEAQPPAGAATAKPAAEADAATAPPAKGAATADAEAAPTAPAGKAPGSEPDPAPPTVAPIYGANAWPCTGHSVCDEASPEDGSLGVAMGGAEHIDPNLVTESSGMFVTRNLFEGLVLPSPDSSPPLPGVATAWSVSDDGKTWTFTLRKDSKWSNGRAVTAHDFVYSWRRKLDPATGSNSAEHHFFIKNARAFNEGKLDESEALGFRATDDHTLVVELEEPTPFWLHYVKSAHYAPVPREAVEAHGKQWTRPEHIITNGPYHMVEWKPRAKMVISKSETYWDAANVRIPRVVIYHSESQEDDLRRYESGQTHWLESGVPTDKISRFIEEKRPDLHIDPFLAIYYYALRTDKPPFDDVRVRRAINMAIDKERLVSHITRGLQLPADGPVPPFFEKTVGYPKPEGDGFDPEKAAELLSQAGYANGVGLPPVTIIYNTYEGHRLIAEFVQRSLKDNLGIEVSIENMEWKSLLKRLRTGDFQISRFGWIGIQDPYGFLNLFRSDSANNEMAYANKEFDDLLDKSLQTRDHAERMKILAAAEARIQKDMPIAPLYYYTRVYLKKPVLRGFVPELNNVHLIKYMYWGDKQEAAP